jgi:competence protein ComEA
VLGAAGTPHRAAPDAGDHSFVDVMDAPDTLPLPASQLRAEGLWRRLIRRLVPESWRAARFDPGRPAATALVLVAALAAVVAAVGVWTGRPQAEPVRGLPAVVVDGAQPSSPPTSPSTSPSTLSPTSTPSSASGTLVVSVSGRVVRPGLVRVPDGARVADVVAAAGGALRGADLTGLNLARRVSDGEQVAVGVPVAPDAGGAQPSGSLSGGAASGASAGPQGKVDLNAATVAQLDALPGVGPITAQHIVDWRTHNGRFAKIEQLREVDGIGEHRFQQLRELVTV